MLNTLVAIILFLLSLLGVYAIWRIIKRGKGKPVKTINGNEEEQNAEKERKRGKEKWGVEKDAYCYPSINDVMGFEFVKVIKVTDESLVGEKALAAPGKNDTIVPVAKLAAVSNKTVNEEQNEDMELPENEHYSPMPVVGKRFQNQEDSYESEPEQVEEGFEESGATEEEIAAFNNVIWEPWPENNDDDMTDEQWERHIRDNANQIEQVPDDFQDPEEVSRAIESYKKQKKQLLDIYTQVQNDDELVEEAKGLLEDDDDETEEETENK